MNTKKVINVIKGAYIAYRVRKFMKKSMKKEFTKKHLILGILGALVVGLFVGLSEIGDKIEELIKGDEE